MSDLVLYIDALYESPWAMSAFVALEEKGLPYAVEAVSLRDKQHHAPEYRAATRRVPALKHGDFWLAESSAIAEYLAETFPFPRYPRLYPEDLKERGVCRMVQAWVRSDFLAIREERPSSTVFSTRTEKPLSQGALGQLARLLEGIDPLIREGRATLFDSWCIADCDLPMMLQRLNLNGHALPAKIKAYTEAAWQRPSIQKWAKAPRPVR